MVQTPSPLLLLKKQLQDLADQAAQDRSTVTDVAAKQELTVAADLLNSVVDRLEQQIRKEGQMDATKQHL
jgi:hypothetical protein